jgi:hypothetical protein
MDSEKKCTVLIQLINLTKTTRQLIPFYPLNIMLFAYKKDRLAFIAPLVIRFFQGLIDLHQD